MGLFIKTRRAPGLFTPLAEAMRRRVLAALDLLSPFLDYTVSAKVGVYRYAPIPLGSEPYLEKRIKLEDRSRAERSELIKSHVTVFLDQMEKKLGTLYETYLVVEVSYKPPILEYPIVVYLLVSNGYHAPADIELEVYEWVYNGEIVDTLEETLKILGSPKLIDILRRISTLAEALRGIYRIEVAAVGPSPEVLTDIKSAKAFWLPTKQKLVSLAIDTLKHRAELEIEAAELYDYYAPHRKDVIVSLIANRAEYNAYLHSLSARGIAEMVAGSLIVYTEKPSLEDLYNDLVVRILKPFAHEVLKGRLSDIKRKAHEVLPRLFRLQEAG